MVRCGAAIHKVSAISFMFLITSVVCAACSPEQPSSPSASPGGASPADVLPPSIAASAPAPSVASLPPLDDVPTYKGNAARTGVQPGPGPIAKPVLVWEAKIDCPVGERAPIIGDGLVYAGCAAPVLIAVDARSGRQVWKAQLAGALIGSAAYGDGAVYAADSGGSFHAFDAASGKERWHLDIKPRGSPVVVDGTVYVGSDDGRVYGLEPADGSVTWSWTAPSGAGGTVVGDTAYLGGDDGLFRAIALADKSERWHLRVLSGHVSSPCIDDSTVVVAGLQEGPDPNGELYAIDRATGTVRWTFRAPSGLQVGPSIIADGVVYATSQQDGLFAFDEENGHVLWNVAASSSYIPAARAGDVIYMNADRGVAAFATADGRKLWETETGFATSASPIASGGMLIVGDAAGSLRAFAEPSVAALLTTSAQGTAKPSPSALPIRTPSDPFELVATFDVKTSDLHSPSGMDLGPDGDLYVVDASTARILVLDPSGKVVRKWGTKGTGDGQFDFERNATDNDFIGGVAVDAQGAVYVADTVNRRVQKSTADGKFLLKWGRFGSADGQFLEPFDLDVAPDGSVYVVDDTRDDIQKFDDAGGFLARIGRHGSGPGELNYTSAVETDGDGNVYNADWDNNRVQAWDSAGTFLWSLGQRGTEPGQLVAPSDVAIDEASNLFVVDRTRVQVFDADHRVIGVWQRPDQGDPTLELGSIVVGKGVAYIAQPFAGRILKVRLVDINP